MKNLLRGTDGAYEVCTTDIAKPTLSLDEVTGDLRSAYEVKLMA